MDILIPEDHIHVRPVAASEDNLYPPEAVGPSRWSEEVVVEEEGKYIQVYPCRTDVGVDIVFIAFGSQVNRSIPYMETSSSYPTSHKF